MDHATNADPPTEPPLTGPPADARARRPPAAWGPPWVDTPEPLRADARCRRPRRRRRWARTGAAVLGVAALSMGAGAVGAGLVVDRGADQGSDAVAIDNVGVDATPGELSVAEIVDGLADSVVSIETTVSYRRGPFEAEGTGAGTGVVLDDGYIVTNAHVVDGASEVEVTVPGTGATIVADDRRQRSGERHRGAARRRHVGPRAGVARRRPSKPPSATRSSRSATRSRSRVA